VLLRLDLVRGSRARDIRDLSALRCEEEASDWARPDLIEIFTFPFRLDGRSGPSGGASGGWKTGVTFRRCTRGQVLLLPNFTMCVTHEIHHVDGFDTIELLEQVGEGVCGEEGERKRVCDTRTRPEEACTLTRVSTLESPFRLSPGTRTEPRDLRLLTTSPSPGDTSTHPPTGNRPVRWGHRAAGSPAVRALGAWQRRCGRGVAGGGM
jgi:hypothetical protein